VAHLPGFVLIPGVGQCICWLLNCHARDSTSLLDLSADSTFGIILFQKPTHQLHGNGTKRTHFMSRSQADEDRLAEQPTRQNLRSSELLH